MLRILALAFALVSSGVVAHDLEEIEITGLSPVHDDLNIDMRVTVSPTVSGRFINCVGYDGDEARVSQRSPSSVLATTIVIP